MLIHIMIAMRTQPAGMSFESGPIFERYSFCRVIKYRWLAYV